MKQTIRTLIIIFTVLSLFAAVYAMCCTGIWIGLHLFDGGFSRTISADEAALREQTVSAAQDWLGTLEFSSEHQEILDIYNSHTPLARGYEVLVSDNWCAAYGSCIAINQDLTEIIPTECGCERQIELWKGIGRWVENDYYLPLPGDYIYYNWDMSWNLGDNSGWADHVGIVVGTSGPMIKVIEGNKDDMVAYRVIFRGDYRIRGYGLPDYAAKAG